METINNLNTLNATLQISLNELKEKAETKTKECDALFKVEVIKFIETALAPAAGLEPDNIYLGIDRNRIDYGIRESNRYFYNYIYKNIDWDTNEYYYEMSYSGFSNINEKKIDQLNFIALDLKLVNFLLQEFKNKTELFMQLVGLQDTLLDIMIPANNAWNEHRIIENAIEDNNKKINELKIDEYLKIGKEYNVPSMIIWLNDKDRERVQCYKIDKITAKKIFFTVYYTEYKNNFEHKHQTSIYNFKAFIQDIIKKTEQEATEPKKEMLES